jgi:hypothetical protein
MAAAIAAAEDGVIDPPSDEGSDGEADVADAEWQVRSVGVFSAISICFSCALSGLLLC